MRDHATGGRFGARRRSSFLEVPRRSKPAPIGETMASADLEWALSEFRDVHRQARYKTGWDYYRGDHPLNFAERRFDEVFRAKFQAVADNLCTAVIDSAADRLEITGFISSAATRDPDGNRTDPIGDQVAIIWARNRMDLRAYEVHREAFITGDGYALVWPDARGRAAIWPQVANEIRVDYDTEQPGVIVRAAKLWRRADNRLRITLYFPDRIERYVSEKVSKTAYPAATLKGKSFVRLATRTELGDPSDFQLDNVGGEVPNPYGRVPIFHFPNRMVHSPGLSELGDVIPLQDALNKTLCDQLVSQEFAAFPQRHVAGLEVEVDEVTGQPKQVPFRPGIEKLWTSPNPEARFGAFPVSDISQFVTAEENLRAEIARVSGTPLHYLFITRGDFPSGEAMKSAEARFTKKLGRAQTNWGNGWEDLSLFALTVEAAEQPPDDLAVSAMWVDASPRSPVEDAATAVNLKAAGVSRRMRLRRLGFTEQEIEEQLLEEPMEAAPEPVATAVGRESM